MMANTMTTPGENKSFSSGYVKVGPLSMYYELRGKGFPIVLIHGGGSTIETSFGSILDSLALHRQVIAVELQAHGHTPDIDRPTSFEQDADDVAALLDHLGLKQADIFGFSNGGNTAIQIANRHPSIIRKLILASTFYKRNAFHPSFFEGLEKATLKDMPEVYAVAFKKITPDNEGLQKMFDRDRNRMLAFKDWPDSFLTSIKAPTLILNGDQDVVMPEHAAEMYRLIPHCRLAIFPGGHGDYMGEILALQKSYKYSDFCVYLIEQFLNEDL